MTAPPWIRERHERPVADPAVVIPGQDDGLVGLRVVARLGREGLGGGIALARSAAIPLVRQTNANLITVFNYMSICQYVTVGRNEKSCAAF